MSMSACGKPAINTAMDISYRWVLWQTRHEHFFVGQPARRLLFGRIGFNELFVVVDRVQMNETNDTKNGEIPPMF
jgi:hypothetical protein